MAERTLYIVTDHNDKDREDHMLDYFETREDAETFARGWVADQGYQGSLADAIEEGMVQIEEWPSLDDFRG